MFGPARLKAIGRFVCSPFLELLSCLLAPCSSLLASCLLAPGSSLLAHPSSLFSAGTSVLPSETDHATAEIRNAHFEHDSLFRPQRDAFLKTFPALGPPLCWSCSLPARPPPLPPPPESRGSRA